MASRVRQGRRPLACRLLTRAVGHGARACVCVRVRVRTWRRVQVSRNAVAMQMPTRDLVTLWIFQSQAMVVILLEAPVRRRFSGCGSTFYIGVSCTPAFLLMCCPIAHAAECKVVTI